MKVGILNQTGKVGCGEGHRWEPWPSHPIDTNSSTDGHLGNTGLPFQTHVEQTLLPTIGPKAALNWHK